MQWTAEPGAGFSEAEPWMMLNPNHVDINAARDRANPDGVFEWYRKLIALRRTESLVWAGAFELLLPNHPALAAYLRTEGARRMLVLGSYSGDEVHLSAANLPLGDWQPVLANADGVNAPGGEITVPPYFAGVWIDEGAGR